MPIKDIKRYAALRAKGDKTLRERLNMLTRHRKTLEEQTAALAAHKNKLDEKIKIYNDKISAKAL